MSPSTPAIPAKRPAATVSGLAPAPPAARPRRGALLTLFSLGLFACGGAQSPSSSASVDPTPAGAHLECQDNEVDFGKVWEGDLLRHSFVFKVVGEGEEAVETVRADCGCTLAELQVAAPGGTFEPYENGSPLAPGSRVRVDVTYNTRGKRGAAPRTITLYAAEGAVSARVLADVTPWLTVEPENQDLGLLRDTESKTVEFRVRSAEGRPFELAHLEKAVPPEVHVRPVPLDASGEPTDSPSSLWSVEVELSAGMPRGTHVYPIELVTDAVHAHGAPITATPYVSVQVVGPVSLSPGSFPFGVLPTGQIVSKTVRYRAHEPGIDFQRPTLRLESVRPEGMDLAAHATLQVLDVPGERAFDLRVTFSAMEALAQGNFLGRLIVETGLPGLPRLEAPVTGVVLPGAARSLPQPSVDPENG